MPSTACARRRAGARPSSRAGRRRAAAVAVLAVCSLPVAASAAPAAGQACAAASAAPGSVAGVTLRRALRCEVNAVRARHGQRPLRASRRLGAAARRHARDMVSHAYFAHERPGSTLLSRARAAGWTGSFLGEAIACGCGPHAVPRAVLGSWLANPPHREIVLGRYRLAGVGLARGAPGVVGCAGAGTWVLDVGR